MLFQRSNQSSEQIRVTPAYGDYEWKSSDPDIADVGSTGRVHAGSRNGTATITATDKTTGKSASIQVKVVRIPLSEYTLYLEEGQEVSVDPDVDPAGTDIYEFASFIPDDPSIAAVKDKCTIQALKEGSTWVKFTNSRDNLFKISVNVFAKGQQSKAIQNVAFVRSDTDVSINDPNGYLDSLDNTELSELKKEYVKRIQKKIRNNSEISEKTKNITKAVRIPADKRALLCVKSELTGIEAEVVSDRELYPTKLIFSSGINSHYFDAKTGRDTWEAGRVDNGSLTGENIDFRLPIPPEITEKYAQIVHKSEGYEDETIPNLEIKRCKVRDTDGKEEDAAYIDVSVTHFSDLIVTFTDEKVKEDSGNNSGNNGGSTGGNTGNNGDNSGNNGGNSGNTGSSNTGSGSTNTGSGSSNSGSGSSNSGSSSSGGSSDDNSESYTSRGTKDAAHWTWNSKGWRFRNADATYVKDRWIELSWNEKSAWYRFNEQGYMITGWFKDGDGNWYFMNDRADGTQGAMVTGWRQIAGKWYYFRVTAGGPKGSLVMNATTPDGYKVDENGAWIQ